MESYYDVLLLTVLHGVESEAREEASDLPVKDRGSHVPSTMGRRSRERVVLRLQIANIVLPSTVYFLCTNEPCWLSGILQTLP